MIKVENKSNWTNFSIIFLFEGNLRMISRVSIIFNLFYPKFFSLTLLR